LPLERYSYLTKSLLYFHSSGDLYIPPHEDDSSLGRRAHPGADPAAAAAAVAAAVAAASAIAAAASAAAPAAVAAAAAAAGNFRKAVSSFFCSLVSLPLGCPPTVLTTSPRAASLWRGGASLVYPTVLMLRGVRVSAELPPQPPAQPPPRSRRRRRWRWARCEGHARVTRGFARGHLLTLDSYFPYLTSVLGLYR
jgi:hypothetical protein